MRAFGFGAGRRDRPHPPVAVAPPVAPGRLATLATAPYAAFGTQRLTDGYTGPLFRLRRASDGAMQDFAPPAGGDYPDRAAIAAWAGGSALSVATLCDQTGNGRHLTQPTAANQPSFDLSQAVGNVVPILFDGYGRSSSGGLPQPQIAKTMSMGGLGLDLTRNSIFMTLQSKVSFNGNAFMQGTDDAVSTAVEEMFILTNGSVTLRTAATNDSTGNGLPRASMDTVGFTSSASARYVYGKGAVRGVAAARSSTVIPRLTIGSSITGGVPYNGMFRLFGMVVYPTALSNTTDGPAVVASLNTAFAKPASYDYTLLLSGDSIMEGSGGLLLQNMPYWLGTRLAKAPELFNMAVHGTTMATQYGARISAAALYVAGRPNVAFLEAGTNDLGAGTTGANLYANSASPYIAYLKGLGYKVVICTILPRTGSTGWTAAMETERGNYNALVVANAAGADGVLDLTRNPVMGGSAAPADPSLYADKLHPTSLGYRWLAGAPGGIHAGTFTYYYALQQILGAIP